MVSKCETGNQLLARLNPRPDISDLEPLLFPKGLKAKDVVEIYGDEGTGKTELLLHFILKCILPKTLDNVSVEGLELSVVFIDTDYHFNLLRLVAILEKKLSSYANLESFFKKNNLEDCIKKCLERLHVVQCSSSLQFLSTLHSLETLLASINDVAILMIDSISAFYWEDRGSAAFSDKHPIKNIVQILERLLQDYNIAIIVTKQALLQTRKERSGDPTECVEIENESEFEFLGKKYKNLITERIQTSRTDEINQIHYYVQTNRMSFSMTISDKGLELKRKTI